MNARLYVRLLGGFRVEGPHGVVPESAWLQRTSAKTLLKLVATDPAHKLHREQIMETLWRDVDAGSARNSFAKALHAARHAIEPEHAPRASSYLVLHDDMVALDNGTVVVDADRFERLAMSALEQADTEQYNIALAAYCGDLLPEDRYADWSHGRRDHLAHLQAKLRQGLGEALHRRGSSRRAVDHLRMALQHDPTNEVVHRQLIRIYAEQGMRGEAVRQFHLCRAELERSLDVEPDALTVALYEDIVSGRLRTRTQTLEPASPSGVAHPMPFERSACDSPFVGREGLLQLLRERFTFAAEGRGGLVLLTGEAGIGKTRLVTEFVAGAAERGAAVLVGGTAMHAERFSYGAFNVAIESYIARRPRGERSRLAIRHEALLQHIPSLGVEGIGPVGPAAASPSHADVGPTIARLLTDLGSDSTVVLVVGDLDTIDPMSKQLLWYLARLAIERRWLLIAACREESLQADAELQRVVDTAVRDGLCAHLRLPCLARVDCDLLVGAILRGHDVDRSLLDGIYSLTLGNPHFVVELTRALRDPDGIEGNTTLTSALSHLAEHVPAGIQRRVESTVSGLEPNVRQLLRLLAAAGTDLTLTELRCAAKALRPSMSGAAVLDALDRALAMQVLREVGGQYSCRHPLVAASLRAALPAHRWTQYEGAVRSARRGDGEMSKIAVLPPRFAATGAAIVAQGRER